MLEVSVDSRLREGKAEVVMSKMVDVAATALVPYTPLSFSFSFFWHMPSQCSHKHMLLW